MTIEMKVDEGTGILLQGIDGRHVSVWTGGISGDMVNQFTAGNGCWVSNAWLDAHPEHDFRRRKQ